MTGKELLSGMSLIDEKFVNEAIEAAPVVRKPHYWYKYAAAACFAVIMIAAMPFLTNHPAENPPIGPSVTDHQPQITDPNNDHSAITINMDRVFLNGVTNVLDVSRLPSDSALYSVATWNWGKITEYYGKDLTPAYIPSGLLAAPTNKETTAYISRHGTVIEDTVRLQFYHAYYEDGSPKMTDDIPLCKGFTIVMSKLGLLNDCVYSPSESELKTTDINGVSVIFGRLSVPYGPYDAKTNEPAGYSDKFIAEFIHDGIEYQILTEQLELNELVKVTASIITGDTNITVK